MTAPIDWEFRLGPIYFNTGQEPDDLGCQWAMPTPDGWDAPEFRGTTTDTPWADGADPGDAFDGARIIHGTGMIQASNAVRLEQAKTRLKTVIRSMFRADGQFEGRPLDGGPDRVCTVRAAGKVAFPSRPGASAVEFDFLVTAGDPLKYSAPASVTVISSTTLGGATFPMSFPVVFAADADTLSPTETTTNPGDVAAPFTVTFNGPLNNPTLIDRLSGQRIPLKVSLPVGRSITVDTAAQTVLNGDGDSAYTAFDDVTGTPLDELTIPGEGEAHWLLLGQGAGTAVVTSSPAWL